MGRDTIYGSGKDSAQLSMPSDCGSLKNSNSQACEFLAGLGARIYFRAWDEPELRARHKSNETEAEAAEDGDSCDSEPLHPVKTAGAKAALNA